MFNSINEESSGTKFDKFDNEIAGYEQTIKEKNELIKKDIEVLSNKRRVEILTRKINNLLELKKAIVACAGPVTNLIIIIITLNLRLNIFTSLLIIYSNILLIIFNLIPMYPLDGGRIVKSLIYLFLGKKKATGHMTGCFF